MDKITRMACDLNEKTDNRYKLVYEISDLAKKIIEEQAALKQQESFGLEIEEYSRGSSLKQEKPVQHAIMVKASESDDDGLVG